MCGVIRERDGGKGLEKYLFRASTGVTTEMEESLFPLGGSILFWERGSGCEGGDSNLSMRYCWCKTSKAKRKVRYFVGRIASVDSQNGDGSIAFHDPKGRR